MSWRGPEHPGEFPTLGWALGEWIEAHCVVPDGDHKGEPYTLTDEMWRFLAFHYRLRLDAQTGQKRTAFRYRRSQLVRPQKWGKGPFSAALICAEAVGPALFDGWDADGEPVGRPWATPLIQITATSDDQTDNVYRALQPMIEEGPLVELIPDTGLTRINLPGGGLIEPVTSNAMSRLGQPVTFCLQDETGIWVKSNRGQLLADTQRRGLAGMGGRSVETTNGWDPTENSVAQQTGEARVDDIYRDHAEAPRNLSIRNKAERRKILRIVYGDSWWVDLDGIEAEILELLDKGEDAQAERFFANRCKSGVGTWLRDGLWESREAVGSVAPGTRIVLGFDGSSSEDWTAIRAETLDGYQFTPCYGPDALPTIWNPHEHGGAIPRSEVHAAVSELFRRYRVQRMYCDPRDWQTEIEGWAVDHGEDRVMEWPTNRVRQMHESLLRFVTDLSTGVLTHDPCPITELHMGNARKVARPGERYILGKPSGHQKIDAAVTSVLAHEARCDAVAAGTQERRRVSTVAYGFN
ncbi:hypothetical protein ACWEV3_40925 [Saccharopolyspora sp. NPDC003752]